VRLIRSKGVGVYFVTQNPLDVPDSVLAQLGNRVQHALRAFTPRDQKAVKAAAETFRQNPAFNTSEAITQLGVGEALVSMLEGKGSPEMVARTLIAPPSARVGPLTPGERAAIINASPLRNKYTDMIDRESAYEVLQKKVETATTAQGGLGGMLGGIFGSGQPGPRGGRPQQSMAEKVLTSALRSAASTAGRQIGSAILRGVLGSLLKR
jgi:DNA helicase HerA-like ATPase